MNILYLAHRIPFPPDKGDKLRAFRQLAHLSKHHHVWCVCFVDDPRDERHVAPLADYCERVIPITLAPGRARMRGIWGLLTGSTITESFYRSRSMRAALEQLTSEVAFDVAVAFSSSMAPYALGIPAKRRVLDLCDLDSEKWLSYAEHSQLLARWLYRTEGRRLALLERRWLAAFDATILITPAEAAGIEAPDSGRKPHVVGNGVLLPDVDARDRRQGGNLQEGEGPIVGFVGQMDYKPNVDAVCWFARRCWPVVYEAFPDARFRVVGRSPSRAVRRLARLPGVEVVGAVEDVSGEVRRFDVSVAPMRIARGLQNKVLEAMAHGKPVVLTSLAADGIGRSDGRHFHIADDAPKMAACVTHLLGDESLRLRTGESARAFVTDRHCWDRELAKFEGVVTGSTVTLRRTSGNQAEVPPLLPEDPALIDIG